MNKVAVGIVTWPIAKSGAIPLNNLVRTATSLFGEIRLISGGEGGEEFLGRQDVMTALVHRRTSRYLVGRVLGYLMTQLDIAFQVARAGRRVGLWIFFIGGPDQIIPVIVAKIMGRRICISFTESSVGTAASKDGAFGRLASTSLGLVHAITCSLSDALVLYSPSLTRSWRLERWSDRINYAHEHMIDFRTFSVKKKYTDRRRVVGFIGRLSQEKGIVNLVAAIRIVLAANVDIGFLIIGDGEERDMVGRLASEGQGPRVCHIEGVAHDQIPAHLNEMSLLVIPSLTEGLPNVMLEAMACGTPVLAARVGSIPDIIEDGKTGYLLRGDRPEQIASSIIAVLSDPEIERTVEGALALVRRDYTPEATIACYGNALSRLVESKREPRSGSTL